MEPTPVRETNGGKFGGWQTIIIVLATWLVSTAVNWGVLQAHQEDMARRQDADEQVISRQVPRAEFDTWRGELNRHLDRMEEKLDSLLEKQR